MKTTVIYHSADFDGIFCREIARRFLPEAELIGWNFGEPPVDYFKISGRNVVVMDLPLDAPTGAKFPDDLTKTIDLKGRYYGSESTVWIDHHKTSIDTHPASIPGYRIDGVAACRLAWQWFVRESDGGKDSFGTPYDLPKKQHFVDRVVGEPRAVRLAGEYDIWDHRGDGDLEFQFGLRAQKQIDWANLLDVGEALYTMKLVEDGELVMRYATEQDASMSRRAAFLVEWEGLKFLCLNTGRFNSQTFAAVDKPETGHDALLGFNFNGKLWTFSLYHAAHRKDLDLSEIAKRYGGGGHRGACGFTAAKLPLAI